MPIILAVAGVSRRMVDLKRKEASMKKILASLLVLGAIGAFAAAPVRAVVDVDGRSTKCQVGDPVGNDKVDFKTPAWVTGDAAASYMLLMGKKNLGETFEEFEVTFTPKQDGEVNLSFRGNQAPEGKTYFVAYDDIKIDGAELVNGSFEEVENGKAKGWYAPDGALVTGSDKAPDGKNYMIGAQKKGFGQKIKVTAGKPVTLKFKAAADKEE